MQNWMSRQQFDMDHHHYLLLMKASAAKQLPFVRSSIVLPVDNANEYDPPLDLSKCLPQGIPFGNSSYWYPC